MAEITKIERLDGKNYQSWKYNIKLVLMERGLWGFVDGTETAPGASAAVTVQSAYFLRSDKANSLIALSVDHPRRPRGSQSGREKRRDESFQMRANEPLGTDSRLS